MATPSSLLTEEQFRCAICLDVLDQPVTIPCGHNFCMACIRKYWDSNELCMCPVCKEHFDCRLEETLRHEIENLTEVKLKMIQQYAVDVTLDPDTANPWLILSEDGKLVRHGDVQNKLPDNPERFTSYSNVLGMQGFSSGRFYYEVQVTGKTRWVLALVLGVARESINRKGNATWSPVGGLWAIHQTDGQKYWARAAPDILLSLRENPQKVGVFVDYEECQVSFYDVKTRSHIYSFTGCTFTEKLYPYLRGDMVGE